MNRGLMAVCHATCEAHVGPSSVGSGSWDGDTERGCARPRDVAASRKDAGKMRKPVVFLMAEKDGGERCARSELEATYEAHGGTSWPIV